MSKAKNSKTDIKNLKDKIRKQLKLVNPNSKNKPAIPSNIGSYFHFDTGILKNKLPQNYFDYKQSTDDESMMGVLRITEHGEDVVDVIYTYPKDMIEYNKDQESKNDELITDVAFEKWKEEKRLNRLIKLRKKRINKSRKKSRKKSGRKKTMKKRTPSLSRQSSSGISDYINSDGTFADLSLSKHVKNARSKVSVYLSTKSKSMKGRSKKKKTKKKKSKKSKKKKTMKK